MNNDFSARISWVVPFFFGPIVVAYFEKKTDIPEPWYTVIFFGSLAFALLLAIFQNRISDEFSKLKSWIKNKSRFIIDSINVKIEYLNMSGDLVSYYREETITKIKGVLPMETNIAFSGEVIDYYCINSKISKVKLTSVNILNDITKHLKKNGSSTYKSIYSLLVKDSFTNLNDEYWNFTVTCPCKDFQLSVVLPINKSIRKPRLFHEKVDPNLKRDLTKSEFKGTEVIDPDMIIHRELHSTIFTVHIKNFEPEDSYQIRWSLSDN